MARRTLSLRGRILAAGASVAATGALIGVMAVGDHSADASSTPSTSSSSRSRAGDGTSDGTSATPRDPQSSTGGGFATPGDDSEAQQPQAQTRTGGS